MALTFVDPGTAVAIANGVEGIIMRRLTILVALAMALSASEGNASPKGSTGSKPAITKSQAPKGGAPKGGTVKGPASASSTVKAKSTHVKTSGKPVKAPTAGAKPTNSGKGNSTHVKTSGKPLKAPTAGAKLAKADARTTKTDTKLGNANAKAVKADAKTAKADQKGEQKTKAFTVATTSTGTSTTPTLIDFTATAVGQKLERNGALRSKIEAKLQAAGYTGTVYEAAYGFRNLGQFNAATNMVQNQGYSFDLLKVLMTGTYVDPITGVVYRANRLADGTVKLVRSELATSPVSTLSLGQSKQAITGGAEMPGIIHTIGTTPPIEPSGVSGTSSTITTTTATTSKARSKKKSTATQAGDRGF